MSLAPPENEAHLDPLECVYRYLSDTLSCTAVLSSVAIHYYFKFKFWPPLKSKPARGGGRELALFAEIFGFAGIPLCH